MCVRICQGEAWRVQGCHFLHMFFCFWPRVTEPALEICFSCLFLSVPRATSHNIYRNSMIGMAQNGMKQDPLGETVSSHSSPWGCWLAMLTTSLRPVVHIASLLLLIEPSHEVSDEGWGP